MPGPEFTNSIYTPINRRPITFRAGMHTLAQVPFNDWGSSRVESMFHAGDLNWHHWNPQVAARIKYDQSVNTQLIGLDSVGGSSSSKPSWTWLIGDPQSVNGTDRYYLVGGDLLNQQVNGVGADPAINSELARLDFIESQNLLLRVVSKLTATTAISVATGIVARRAKSTITRRTVLASIGGLIAALGTSVIAPIIQTYTNNPELAEVAQDLTDATRFGDTGSIWLNARTALVTAKTIDAMDSLPNLDAGVGGSIVFGWPHGLDATPIMHDRELRAMLFRNYLLNLHPNIYKIELKYGIYSFDPNSQRASLENLARSMASYQVWEIHQPAQTDGVKNPTKAVEKLMIPVYQRQCPEVVAALSSILDQRTFNLL